MTRWYKVITLLFVIFFSAIAVYIIAIVISYNRDIDKYGAEMSDIYFLPLIIFGSVYYGALLIWSLKIFLQKTSSRSTRTELLLISLLGPGSVLLLLIKTFN